MQFKEGTDIFTADGEKVGEVSRLVVDPKTQEISHVVIEKGFIFTESRVMPISWVDKATTQAVHLRADVAKKIADLLHFKETHFVAETVRDESGDPNVEPLYWYPPQGVVWWQTRPNAPYPGAVGAPAAPPYLMQTEKEIPEGAVVLEEGMKVLDKFDEHVGDVARIFADEAGEHITHLLISQGFLLTEERLVPSHWITQVTSDGIQLAVSGTLIEGLPEYETV